jgi:hypothetical protein
MRIKKHDELTETTATVFFHKLFSDSDTATKLKVHVESGKNVFSMVEWQCWWTTII